MELANLEQRHKRLTTQSSAKSTRVEQFADGRQDIGVGVN
jgi:hypothetical protein